MITVSLPYNLPVPSDKEGVLINTLMHFVYSNAQIEPKSFNDFYMDMRQLQAIEPQLKWLKSHNVSIYEDEDFFDEECVLVKFEHEHYGTKGLVHFQFPGCMIKLAMKFKLAF